jgi:hypothetical protein
LKIRHAFPALLNRQYPIVKATYPLLTVLYLLRMQDVDAVPITPITKKGARAVFGFSSLPQFMDLGPNGFAKLLRGPCEVASDELTMVSADDDLQTLLSAFESRKLGIALIHGDDGRETRTGLMSLSDVLPLYGSGILHSKATVEEVGTPIFSMPGTTTIRETLKAMFCHRYRRVFLSGDKTPFSYVSDRTIMSYLFSPTVLEELDREDAKDVLSTPIAKVGKVAADVTSSRTSLKTAALALTKKRGGCLVTRDGGVLTPWDAVMKPWSTGKLTIEKKE